MTEGGEIEALVRRLCAARVAGDMDVLRRGYADNATFRNRRLSRLGRAHGARDGPCQDHGAVRSP